MADAMVNNKQVNFWRGDTIPPTIYHIWIKDNSKMLLYDGEKWVVFLDNKEIIDILDKVQQLLDEMQAKIDEIDSTRPALSAPRTMQITKTTGA